MTQKIKMMQRKAHTFISHRTTYFIVLLIVVISFCGCSVSSSAKKVEFLERVFDFSSAFHKGEGNQEWYISTKLDSLFEIVNGQYLVPDIHGVSFDNYSVQVVSCLSEKKKLLLFYGNDEILRDTLTLSLTEDFSINTSLSEGGIGVCTGIYSEEFNRMSINRIYVIYNLKLKKVPNSTIIMRCQVPQEYLTEENPQLEETFSFRVEPNLGYRKNNSAMRDSVLSHSEFNRWIGRYRLILELTRELKSEELKIDINIESEDQITIQQEVFGETENILNLKIREYSESEIIIYSPDYERVEYFLSKSEGVYYLSGFSVYMINPPNESYEITKYK